LNGNSRNFIETDLPALNYIYFYLTEGCNLACRHCWIAPKFDEKGKLPSLPIKLFKAAISEAKPLGLKGVKLTGGEPLMHPTFSALLEIVRSENLELTIETNGLLCTYEVATEIAKLPKRFVSVSIDGSDAATHEWLRGVPGCFEMAKEAVRNLVTAGIKPQIIMTLMQRNIGHIEEVIHMAEQLGASSIKFNVVQPTARGEYFSESGETPRLEEIIKKVRYIEQKLSLTTKLSLIFGVPYAFRSLSHISKGNGCEGCNIVNVICVIASGHYALCGIGNHIPELVFGSVGKDKLEDIWKNSEVLNSVRTKTLDNLEGICSRCLMKQTCLGGCIAQNYYRHKNLWAPYWFCDQADKANLFPSSRLIK
jgi:SynChlorMet cassette radical SAM/SPASM protein ScmF